MSSTVSKSRVVTDHARDQWRDRSSQPWRDLTTVWSESFRIDHPAAHSGAESFYHPPTEIVLLVQSDDVETLVTCIDLNDRCDAEQSYVRSQI
ncbi:hypothetical protein [Natronoglomus mannanivorans]|uniref:RelE toxin-related domain-containing protein n=1 Tax=Natronoglomus mannanivorans TaxID=2979990 RepID=A0AAP2Z1K7_9EURY|nr:hypothetical protein [Halobacteria archaeon AArc-xg1-1]